METPSVRIHMPGSSQRSAAPLPVTPLSPETPAPGADTATNGASETIMAGLVAGNPAEAQVSTHVSTHAINQRAASWSTAWRAGGWAALRELVAQGTAVMVSIHVRSALESESLPAQVTCGVGAAIAMGLMVSRCTDLIVALCRPTSRKRSLTIRTVAIAVPVACVLAGAASAAGAGTLVQANAYLVSKLVQRCARDLTSNAMAGVLPSCEVVDSEGAFLPREELGSLEWRRALITIVPTATFFMAQEFLAPAPVAVPSTEVLSSGWPYVVANGCVEAARSLCGTLVTAAIAHADGQTLRPREAEGLDTLVRNLQSLSTLHHAADAASMRQYLGILPDMAGVLAGTPSDQSLIALRILRPVLKGLGEMRAPMVTQGRLVLSREQQPGLPPVGLHAPPYGDNGLSPDTPELVSEACAVVYHATASRAGDESA